MMSQVEQIFKRAPETMYSSPFEPHHDSDAFGLRFKHFISFRDALKVYQYWYRAQNSNLECSRQDMQA